MDGKTAALKEKFERLLRETAEAAAALQAAERGGEGTPHFQVIENAAHEVGCRLSRQVQERAAREVAALSAATAECPECGQPCRVMTEQRTIRSIDGPLGLLESRCECDRCRRSFFPSAGSVGAGRAGIDSWAGAADRVCDG